MLTMPAAVAVAQGQIRCEQVPTPEPTPGKVLVRTELASICGSDLHVVHSEWKSDEFPLPPGAPGHEGIGRVVDAGGTEFAGGELVLTVPKIWEAKTFAGYQLIEAEQLLKPQPNKPLAHLLMAQQLGTVLFACRLLPPLQGATVVVIGQGTAGLFHDFMLRRLGAQTIIAIDPIAARLATARAMGVDEVVDVTGVRANEAVLDLTGGIGADVVIEAVGSVETLNQTLELARPRGCAVAFGLPTTAQRVPFDWDLFFSKSLTIHAIHSGQEEPGLPDFRQALDLITRGEIDVSPFLTHQFHISQVDEAFELADSKEDGVLKVSLTF